MESCELGFPVKVKVFAPKASLRDISARIKCIANPLSIREAEVTSSGLGLFSISVTSHYRGGYDLIVTVKESEIDGSPFWILVKLPPSQLGRDQVYVIGGLVNP